MKKVTAWSIGLIVLLVSGLCLSEYSFAKGGFKVGGGGGFRSSGASKSVWGSRSGGGLFGSKSSSPAPSVPSSGGYSKPSAPSSSGGYSKPAPSAPSSLGGSAKTTQSAPASSGGYSKPQPAGSSASSGGYGKPSTAQGSGSSGSTGYAKPSSNSTAKAPKPSLLTGSKFDAKAAQQYKAEKSAASLSSYREQQAQFKKAAAAPVDDSAFKSNPIYGKAKNYGGFDYGSYYNRRDGYYGSQNWTPPVYTYNSAPRFGMWDALFWWMMLDNLGNNHYAAAAYNHSNDPGYQEWRKEADRLAADNKDLKEKLAKLDQKTAAMEGQPRDPSYLPEGILAEVALRGGCISKKISGKCRSAFCYR